MEHIARANEPVHKDIGEWEINGKLNPGRNRSGLEEWEHSRVCGIHEWMLDTRNDSLT